MNTRTIIDKKVVNGLEKHYDAKIQNIQFHGSGKKGSVYRINLITTGGTATICLKEDSDQERSQSESFLCKKIYTDFNVFEYAGKDKFYFTMPFFEGISLSKIDPKTINFKDRLILIKSLVVYLIKLHKAGVLHRDLKDFNIIYNPAAKNSLYICTIIDFGRSVEFIDANGKPKASTDKLTLNPAINFFSRVAKRIELTFSGLAPEYVNDSRSLICLKTEAYHIAAIVERFLPEFPDIVAEMKEELIYNRLSIFELALILTKMLAAMNVKEDIDVTCPSFRAVLNTALHGERYFTHLNKIEQLVISNYYQSNQDVFLNILSAEEVKKIKTLLKMDAQEASFHRQACLQIK